MTPYYQDDHVTLYHGDCRDVLPTLAPVDLVVTDPPYGVGFQYGIHEDAEAGYWEWMGPLFEMLRGMAPVVLITTGFRHMWKYPPPTWALCWAKPGSVRASALGGFSEWEPVLVYGKRRIYNDLKVLPDAANHSREAGWHPCPKPLRLMTWLVTEGSDPGATVLDPFAGSGTTLVAAKQVGRKAIGIEIDEAYCEGVATRLSQEVLGLTA